MKFLVLRKSSLIQTLVISLVLTLTLVFVGFSGAAAVYTNARTPRKLPIYCVETEEKKVAITFDAAWGADKTEQILGILEEFDAKATFFVVGFWARKYPDKLKLIAEQGIEVGTHSNTHAHCNSLSESQLELELTTSSASITEAIGVKPSIFRCPFGEYNDRVISVSERLGYKVIQWDVDSLDWKGLSAGDMAARVLAKVNPGSIILFHNDGEHTPAALSIVLERLIADGYTTETVSGLVYKDGYTIDSSGRQIKSAV